MALMTLLEGHADHVMDAVGPTVVPSVAAIRASFTERRKRTKGPIDRLLRALLGMDMKLAQYVKGGAFVGAVVDQVGMAAFNAVWTSPDTLPTRAEIADPAAWVAPGARLSRAVPDARVGGAITAAVADLAGRRTPPAGSAHRRLFRRRRLAGPGRGGQRPPPGPAAPPGGGRHRRPRAAAGFRRAGRGHRRAC